MIWEKNVPLVLPHNGNAPGLNGTEEHFLTLTFAPFLKN